MTSRMWIYAPSKASLFLAGRTRPASALEDLRIHCFLATVDVFRHRFGLHTAKGFPHHLAVRRVRTTLDPSTKPPEAIRQLEISKLDRLPITSSTQLSLCDDGTTTQNISRKSSLFVIRAGHQSTTTHCPRFKRPHASYLGGDLRAQCQHNHTLTRLNLH